MPAEDPILIRVLNRTNFTVTANNSMIEAGDTKSYRLRSPSISATGTVDGLQFTFDGERVDDVPISLGMCLCLSSGAIVELVLAASIAITLTGRVGDLPEGVRCGEGTPD